MTHAPFCHKYQGSLLESVIFVGEGTLAPHSFTTGSYQVPVNTYEAAPISRRRRLIKSGSYVETRHTTIS